MDECKRRGFLVWLTGDGVDREMPIEPLFIREQEVLVDLVDVLQEGRGDSRALIYSIVVGLVEETFADNFGPCSRSLLHSLQKC